MCPLQGMEILDTLPSSMLYLKMPAMKIELLLSQQCSKSPGEAIFDSLQKLLFLQILRKL